MSNAKIRHRRRRRKAKRPKRPVVWVAYHGYRVIQTNMPAYILGNL